MASHPRFRAAIFGVIFAAAVFALSCPCLAAAPADTQALLATLRLEAGARLGAGAVAGASRTLGDVLRKLSQSQDYWPAAKPVIAEVLIGGSLALVTSNPAALASILTDNFMLDPSDPLPTLPAATPQATRAASVAALRPLLQSADEVTELGTFLLLAMFGEMGVFEELLAKFAAMDAAGRLSDEVPLMMYTGTLVCLARSHIDEALERLALHVTNPSSPLRRTACTVLGLLGDPRAAVPLLAALAANKDPEVAAELRSSLDALAETIDVEP